MPDEELGVADVTCSRALGQLPGRSARASAIAELSVHRVLSQTRSRQGGGGPTDSEPPEGAFPPTVGHSPSGIFGRGSH